MRFSFDSFVSIFQRRQQAVAKLFHPDVETISIAFKNDEGLDCRYEIKIPAPIRVAIHFSNGRSFNLGSDGQNEIVAVGLHDKPPMFSWLETHDDDGRPISRPDAIKSIYVNGEVGRQQQEPSKAAA